MAGFLVAWVSSFDQPFIFGLVHVQTGLFFWPVLSDALLNKMWTIPSVKARGQHDALEIILRLQLMLQRANKNVAVIYFFFCLKVWSEGLWLIVEESFLLRKWNFKDQSSIQHSWSTILTDCSFGISCFQCTFRSVLLPCSFPRASKGCFITHDQMSHLYLDSKKIIWCLNLFHFFIQYLHLLLPFNSISTFLLIQW